MTPSNAGMADEDQEFPQSGKCVSLHLARVTNGHHLGKTISFGYVGDDINSGKGENAPLMVGCRQPQ